MSPKFKMSLMSAKFSLTGQRAAWAMAAAGLIAVSAIAASQPGRAQTSSTAGTRSIEAGSEAAKKARLKEPSYMTREERLNAKPLDWSATSGKAKPRTLSAAERKALQDAKPEQSAGGAPNPSADEEARRERPDDWK